MRIKLDENLGQRVAAAFRAAGHDVATVFEQRLTGATDQQLFGVCVRERRILVSLDTDFANPLRFDPLKSAGIIVLRVHSEPTRSELDDAGFCTLSRMRIRPLTSGSFAVGAYASTSRATKEALILETGELAIPGRLGVHSGMLACARQVGA